jgi:trans-aconitate 2-methyltransferase
VITYKAMPHDWDAETYSRAATGVHAIAAENLDRLVLRGDETVLDAGCGSGEVTQALLERLPDGRVLAVDASPTMVAALRARLGGDARVTAWVSDLLELEVPEPVDAVFSTATFHWIADHDRLFARAHAALRPGGQLVAQCGGVGNIAQWHAAAREVGASAPFAPWLDGFDPWNYATPADTEERLRRAGFAQARAWLIDRELDTPDPRGFVRSTFFGAHLAQLPAEHHDAYLDAIMARASFPAQYVRLNIDALA